MLSLPVVEPSLAAERLLGEATQWGSRTRALTPQELAAFRAWFVEHDWQAWDREIEKDSAEGRLDRFAAEALAEFDRDETTEL